MEGLDFLTIFKHRLAWPNSADDFFNDKWTIKFMSIKYWSPQLLVLLFYVIQLFLYTNPRLNPICPWGNFTLRSWNHSLTVFAFQLFQKLLLLIPVKLVSSPPRLFHCFIIFYFWFSTHKALAHIQPFKRWIMVILLWRIAFITNTIVFCHMLLHLFVHFFIFSPHFQMRLPHIS